MCVGSLVRASSGPACRPAGRAAACSRFCSRFLLPILAEGLRSANSPRHEINNTGNPCSLVMANPVLRAQLAAPLSAPGPSGDHSRKLRMWRRPRRPMCRGRCAACARLYARCECESSAFSEGGLSAAFSLRSDCPNPHRADAVESVSASADCRLHHQQGLVRGRNLCRQDADHSR